MLKWVPQGIIKGIIIRVLEGDTRSLDSSSYRVTRGHVWIYDVIYGYEGIYQVEWSIQWFFFVLREYVSFGVCRRWERLFGSPMLSV